MALALKPGRGAGGGLSAQCEASSASRGGSKPMNKAPASSVPYTQVSIINLRIRGPPAPSEGCVARVTSPPTSSGRALTRTTSEQAEGPGSASKQPGGPRGGDAAPRPSPAPRPAAGGSPINPCPGSREAAAPAPQPSATFPSLAPASPPGPGPVGRPPARPPSFPPAPTPGGRPAGRPRAAAPPPKMAGPSLRPAGLGAGPGCRPQWGKPGRRAPGGAAAGHSPGRWRGARAVPSGESLPPASRRRRCAPAAASAASAAPAASLSAPGAPGSAVSEPQPPQVSLPGSRVRAAPGGAGVCVEAGEAAAPLPGKYRSPRTPSPAARRGPRGPARPAQAAAAAAPAPPARGVRSPEPDLGRDQQQRRQQSPRIPPPLSPPPPPPHSTGAFYYYSGGKRKGLKKNPTNKMATDRPGRYSNCQSKRKPPPPAADVLTSSSRHPRPQAGGRGHVKDKFGARYECQRRARDSLGGGERRGDGPAEGREGEEEDRAGGRVGAEAAARPVREHPPLPRPPGRTPARACRARADCGPGSARVPSCAPPPPPPAEPGASASRACSPARAGGPGLLTCIPGERAAGRARPRTQAALGPARVPPSPEKMPTEAAAAAAAAAAGGGGEEAASALQTSQEFRTLRPGSGMPLRPTPLLNPGGRSLQRPAPAFRNDGRSHHKHSRLFHGFQPPHSPSLSGRSLPSPSECPEN
ncbi:basic proline-rich protein-like [Dama dama]|uniref:basic proline-rich protein-like n=1 Tax=Dama dama TaxID=30532 RepID=UPI002A36C3B5|nr:basic proline-rich protein-like [Dama dama]